MATIDIRIASTTSVVDSGLMEKLNNAFQSWQNSQVPTPTNIYNLNWETPNPLSLGSGAAMQAARDGKADIVISHDRVGEMEFWAQRFALVRKHLFFNNFVLVGPANGSISPWITLQQGFTLIQNKPYVTRGASGRSGTYIREQQILNLFNLTLNNVFSPPIPQPPDPPYPSMAATLEYAADNGYYTFTDIGTWYEFHQLNNGRLILLTSPNDYPWDDPTRDPLASNQYVGMPINPNACFDTPPQVPINTDGAFAFLRWMHTSSGDNNAKDTVNGYKINIGTLQDPIEKQGFIYNACSEHFPDNKCLIKPVE